MANLRVDKITSTETFETTGSVQFVRVPTSRLTTDLGSGLGDDFTIEFWILASGIASGSNSPGMFQLSDTSGGLKASTESLSLAWSTTNNYSIFYAGSIGTGSITNDPNTNDVWKHYAMVRNNGVLKIYVDGIEKTSVNVTDDFSGYRYLAIGTYYSTSYPWQGHISNFRILNNKALYTENFKPPMRELEVTPETVLLACQHKTDATHEKTGKTITVNGDAVANELTPGLLTDVVKSGGNSAITGSVEFDGTGDYLTLANSSDFDFGTGDFTVECFIHVNKHASGATDVFVSTYQDSTNGWTMGIHATTDKFYFAIAGDSAQLDDPGNLLTESWVHLAASRKGSLAKFFVNGVEVTSASNSTNQSSTSDLHIGTNVGGGALSTEGFISNLRIVKGTALYTANFIPPTRELKKVPGTVLLCCQDSNDPTTEATGKTITSYGSLGNGSLGSELVTSNDIWTMECGGSGCSNWTASNNGSSLAGTTVTSGYIRATYTVPEGDYLVSFRWTGGDFAVQSSAGYLVATDGTSTQFGSSEDGAYSVYMTDTTYVRFTGSSWNTAYTVDDISIKRIYKNNGASNFTPQVGNDGSVEFVGPTKIDTENYFYLPTGNTATRDSRYGRGLIMGGANTNLIEYINIATQGNTQHFGDLTSESSYASACSSSTRGICFLSRTPATPAGGNTLDYVTIASTGNSQDFGDTTAPRYESAAASSNTRGLIAGGYLAPGSGTPANSVVIDYVTIASTGDAITFGDLTYGRRGVTGLSSPTRGCFAAGYQQPDTTTETNIIDYVTIASTGNALDFGDLIAAVWGPASLASSTRGIWASGSNPLPTNVINYVTIASTGNAQDFGDLSLAAGRCVGMSNSTRGVMGLEGVNTMDFVTIASTGDAQDFGDMMTTISGVRGGCSDSHGGLG